MAFKKNPLAAPWPPGIDVRIIQDQAGRRVMQVRPGGTLPVALYVAHMGRILKRRTQRSLN